jgi:hypothetical protein
MTTYGELTVEHELIWVDLPEVWLDSESLELDESPEDVGKWLGNIGSGVASGAATGLAAGPWGALVGGLVGGGLGALQTALSQNQQPPQPQPLPQPSVPPRPVQQSAPPPSPVAVGVQRPAPRAVVPQQRVPATPAQDGALTVQLGQLVPAVVALLGQLSQILKDSQATGAPAGAPAAGGEVEGEAQVQEDGVAERHLGAVTEQSPVENERAASEGSALQGEGSDDAVEGDAAEDAAGGIGESGEGVEESAFPRLGEDVPEVTGEWLPAQDRQDDETTWAGAEEAPWTT